MKIIDLFAGIGGMRLGFEAHGCTNVFSSEWDKDAQIVYEANFREKPFGDIDLIDPQSQCEKGCNDEKGEHLC
jgi:DNA (cytosine-5)-methyltransferase 1